MSWSAEGRPEWLHERRSDIGRVFLIVFCIESPSVYRCLAIVFTAIRTAWTFTIDVAFEDFEALPASSVGELVELTQSLLYGFPMLPLDPAQEERWRCWRMTFEKARAEATRLSELPQVWSRRC
jgi:hypothetical protein